MPRSDTTSAAPTSTTGHLCTGPDCYRPAPDGAICRTCGDQLEADLLTLGGRPDVPGLAAELLVTMARQAVLGDRHGVREPGLEPETTDQPIAEVALPLDVSAGDVLAEVRTVLARHVGYVLERRYARDLDGYARDRAYRRAGGHGPVRRPPVLPDPTDASELARWLGRHRLTIVASPAAGQISADVARLVLRARDVVFPQSREYMGPCGHCSCPTGSCPRCADLLPTQLYIERGAVQVVCPHPKCGRTWRVEDRRAWLDAQADDQLVTATEASRALPGLVDAGLLGDKPLTADKIRGWARRGRIAVYRPHPHDWTVDDDGRPVQPAPRFRVGDLRGHLAKIAADGDRA